MLIGLRRRLLAQAPLVLHLVNYQRVFHRGAEALPLEVRPAAEGERILVQLVRPREDRIVTHTSATLIHRPTTQPVMELVDSQRIQVRGWTLEELETLLDVARFSILEVHGDMEGSPYDPERSPELVVIAG